MSTLETRMIDVGDKAVTKRRAVARGVVRLGEKTLCMIREGRTPKGDVLGAARVAGIMGAKRTRDLLPLCHPLPLNTVEVGLEFLEDGIEIVATASAEARTGVEMEALTAVSVAALTIYDMCKAVEPGAVIGDIRLVEKSGGKSGHVRFEGSGP